MKEMKYQATRLNPPEQLATGEYKGYNYYVLNLGTHPCAYVEVPNTSRHFGKLWDEIEVECNGGLTYSRSRLVTVKSKDSWFLGWDYCHCWDYSGYDEIYGGADGKKHETPEMVDECKSVIDQLIRQAEVQG